jgi:Helicase associated domain
MKGKLIKPHKYRWERGFAALSKFRRRKGHCCLPQHHLEGKYNLGRWVTTQRYCKGHLSVERKRRLDRIGFVWNWRDFVWERGFAAPLKFKRREGHSCVPIEHREGNLRLGNWILVQRREKNKMSAKRRARLNKIGFVWKGHRGRPHWGTMKQVSR